MVEYDQYKIELRTLNKDVDRGLLSQVSKVL
jgi:hypothetical protein